MREAITEACGCEGFAGVADEAVTVSGVLRRASEVVVRHPLAHPMKTHVNAFRTLLMVGFCAALAAVGRAQVVQFNATLSGAQEVPATGSSAGGTAIMLYDVTENTFDLVVSLNGFANTLTGTTVQEGAAGAAGSGAAVATLGAEAAYTRNGNTLTATFHGIAYSGTKLTLLQNGAFINFRSAALPNGEIRGQFIARPVRLYANMTVAQEQAAFPAIALTGNAAAFGGAVMTYDPGVNKVNLRISVYNYPNTLTLSHFHEQAPGVSGPVVTNLGAGTVSNYVVTGTTFAGTFINLTYTGDPIKLLTGGAYLNFHSNIFPSGECRGQVAASNELFASRMVNLSSRGLVGTGGQVLIGGFSVAGPEPVRVLVTAKGPSLTAFGLTGVLTDPVLTVYDSTGRAIATNDNVGTVAAGSELSTLQGVPTNTSESALLLILPPGNYSAVVSGASGGTGVALLEATDLRGPATTTASPTSTTLADFDARLQRSADLLAEFRADQRLAEIYPKFLARPKKPGVPELCVSTPLALISR